MQVRLIDLMGVLSRALDLMSSTLGSHHARVGYLAARLAGRMGLRAVLQRDVLIAAMLHDAGAVALHTALETLGFERDLFLHARAGEHLFAQCAGMERVATLIGLHHAPWQDVLAGAVQGVRGSADAELAMAASIITCADFIDVRLRRDAPLAPQLGPVLAAAYGESGRLLNPECVALFADMATEPEGLAGLGEAAKHLYTDTVSRPEEQHLRVYDITRLCAPFAQVIDFRSRFTATHSRGVAVVAQVLARLSGLSQETQLDLYVAGLLHDLGKLAVPTVLLEKKGPLDDAEFATVRTHAQVTKTILDGVPGLEKVCEWAAQHHERLDGSGYPQGYRADALSVEARVLQVADVFTAIAEDRPYRTGMRVDQMQTLLRSLVDAEQLDAKLTSLLLEFLPFVNRLRQYEQDIAQDEFEQFSLVLKKDEVPACVA